MDLKQALENLGIKIKGNRLAIPLNFDQKNKYQEEFWLDDKKHTVCEICDNSIDCRLVELHHKDHNNSNNHKSNVQWLCWFCHHHGWHGDPFDDYGQLWGYFKKHREEPVLLAAPRNKNNKRILYFTKEEYVDLMTNPQNKHDEYLRFGIQSEIGVWSNIFRNTNKHIIKERLECCSDISRFRRLRKIARIEVETLKIDNKLT